MGNRLYLSLSSFEFIGMQLHSSWNTRIPRADTINNAYVSFCCRNSYSATLVFSQYNCCFKKRSIRSELRRDIFVCGRGCINFVNYKEKAVTKNTKINEMQGLLQCDQLLCTCWRRHAPYKHISAFDTHNSTRKQ